jgi:hypothetical protein
MITEEIVPQEARRRFMKIACRCLRDFHVDQECPNQIVGLIHVSGDRTKLAGYEESDAKKSKEDFEKREPLNQWRRNGQRLIILVLESPHTSEYKGDSPKPAAGTSGRAIRELFGEACPLHSWLGLPRGDYSLAILNAIPYQCSFGNISMYRDRVFRLCWRVFGRCYFIERLKEVYSEGDVIINACTKGKHKPELRELVRNAINAFALDASKRGISCKRARVNHPASWIRERNTAKKQERLPDYGWKFVE